MIDINLDGKRAIVTGAASGIGAAVAALFARAGADLVLVDQDGERLQRVRSDVERYARSVAVATLDVADSTAVNTLVGATLADGRAVDIVVNNAGIAHALPLQEITDSEWDRVLNTNLRGCFNFARALFPHMKERGIGRIINVSSINAKTGGGVLSTSGYAAAKAGILGLTKGLAREGAPYGILANAVAPGLIKTPMTERGLTRERFDAAVETIPLKRPGTPDDVAGVILFLASPLAGYMTGAVVHVNGGLLMAD
jgi:NAD(P)-dependent dehydrogenase (short-subunit alcohol dehydrogenase family)